MKAKCISLEEKTMRYWNEFFTIGKIYDVDFLDEDGCMLVFNDKGETFWVDKDCFELIK